MVVEVPLAVAAVAKHMKGDTHLLPASIASRTIFLMAGCPFSIQQSMINVILEPIDQHCL
jgi:hypothetical protein